MSEAGLGANSGGSDTGPDARVDADANPTRPPADPVAVAAVVVGCLGIVFFGIVAAILTAVLAAEAGRRARDDRRSQENAYLAVGLAFLDGAFWLFLHYQFQLPIWIG